MGTKYTDCKDIFNEIEAIHNEIEVMVTDFTNKNVNRQHKELDTTNDNNDLQNNKLGTKENIDSNIQRQIKNIVKQLDTIKQLLLNLPEDWTIHLSSPTLSRRETKIQLGSGVVKKLKRIPFNIEHLIISSPNYKNAIQIDIEQNSFPSINIKTKTNPFNLVD